MAKRPSNELKHKINTIPPFNRRETVAAEDFIEISELFESHADEIEETKDMVIGIGSGEGGKGYPTLAAALAADIPDNVIFEVDPGDPDEGIWRRDSSDERGAFFLREHPNTLESKINRDIRNNNNVQINIPISTLYLKNTAVTTSDNKISLEGFNTSEFIRLPDSWRRIHVFLPAGSSSLSLRDENTTRIHNITGASGSSYFSLNASDFPAAEFFRFTLEMSKTVRFFLKIEVDGDFDISDRENYLQKYYKTLGYSVHYIPFSIENFPVEGIIRRESGSVQVVEGYRSTELIELPENWERVETITPESRVIGLSFYRRDLRFVGSVGSTTLMRDEMSIPLSRFPDATFFKTTWKLDEEEPYYLRIIVRDMFRVEEKRISELHKNDILHENRMANPTMTTFDRFNSAYPANPITKEKIFDESDDTSKPISRIPSVIVTPNGTVLAACEKRQAAADSGIMDVVLKRKVEGGDWVTQNIYPNSPGTYGRAMNPCFVIDRTGAHGVQGRIYFFVFTCTDPAKLILSATTAELDCIYKTSDDDGATWSDYTSIKDGWDLEEYKAMGNSPANGIQTTNGTLALPAMAVVGNKWTSAIIYKTPSGGWEFSGTSERRDDNESWVVERGDNELVLNCRDEAAPYRRSVYVLDWETNVLKPDVTDKTFEAYLRCQQAGIKIDIGGQDVYLMNFPDVSDSGSSGISSRRKMTIWASLDLKKWIRIYLANEAKSNGYGVLNSNGDKLFFIHEENYTDIELQDLTNLKPFIKNQLETQYIRGIEDRLQDLFNAFI